MKACIYNPYLDTLGGGERYTMAVASVLVKHGYRVDVEWKNQEIKKKLEDRFSIDLGDINFVSDIKRGDQYDMCFWVSDGSIPALKARNNFLHFQVPFQKVNGKSLINKFKLMRVKKVICNSNFTKNVIDKEFGIESVILYPPVGVHQFKPKKKENLILGVGRFSQLLQSKRQDVLIKAFKNFSQSQSDYKLVLAGGIEVGATGYLDELKNLAKGLAVEFVGSPSFKELKELYGRAKFFWSATGFGIDDQKEPEKMEHFGIVVVEAMASAAVPIIYNGGGHKEIIENNGNGFLWSDTIDLLKFTMKMVRDEKLRKNMAIVAKQDALKYSYEEFERKFIDLL